MERLFSPPAVSLFTQTGWRMNGELAITADVIRTAEGLRQGVSEARQLVHLLRGHGCERFALWATSYGGWIGALLLSMETGFIGRR
jgi:hypothetical protein